MDNTGSDDGEGDHYRSSSDNNDNGRPLCSVLSTVINHYMAPPSPLEPKEFQERIKNSTPIKVPVLRVFGPIVRGDAPSGKDPVQSACLYIHGAYPYLLARPVAAGPDGSLHHSSHLINNANFSGTTSSGHVDWDHPQAVERVASVIERNLEAALQASVTAFDNNNNKEKGVASEEQKPPKFIRSVTVVMGRGFYTYCPGPAAPFLRVEYYDPRVRWKVKMTLERGLADLPHRFHPDPQQYDSVGQTPAADSSQLGVEPLSFHCYEAHIPYTMQFFKDWNLAGMSYIHLSQGKFRPRLPSHVIPRWDPSDVDDEIDERSLAFLSSNTRSKWLWEEEEEEEEEKTESDAGSQVGTSHSDQGSIAPPLSKEVQVVQVCSTADENDSNAKIPLPEKKAKKANKPLWSTKETSCDVEIDVHVSSILNIQSVIKDLPQDQEESKNIHWRAVPSLKEIWREERRRMAKLLEPKHDFLSRQSTPNSSDSKDTKVTAPPFTLSVKKDSSTPGAMLAAKGMKRLLNVTGGLEQDFMRAARQIIQRHNCAISRVDKMLLATPTTRKSFFHASHSTASASAESPQLTPTVDDALDALGALASQFDQSSDANPNSDALLQDSGSDDDEDDNSNRPELSLSQNGFQPMSSQNCETLRRALDEDSPMDQYKLSQRIERGDSIIDGRDVEDYVDPETLIPYETTADEAGDDDHEDNLAEADMERVLTTLGTQLVNIDDQKDSHPASIETLNGVEEVLDGATGDSFEGQDDSESCVSSSSIRANDEVSSDESAIEPTTTTVQVEATKAKSTENETRGVLTPPKRGAINSSQLSLNRRDPKKHSGAQPWLPHSSAYEDFRIRAKMKTKWTASSSATAFHIQPTQQPPRRDEVMYWHQKQSKRRLSDAKGVSRKKRKAENAGKAREYASATHEVDNNTGKIVPAAKKGSLSIDNSDTTGTPGEVEEVRWVASQSQTFSATQEEERETVEEPKKQAAGFNPTFTATSVMNSQSLLRVAADLSTPAATSGLTDAMGSQQALQGMQNQGGKLVVEGGGQLKANLRPTQTGAIKGKESAAENAEHVNRYLPTPLTMMSIEVHVQCRTGRAGVSSANIMAMTPDPDRDRIFAIAYAYGRDPGGGAALDVLERGCLFVPLEQEGGAADRMQASLPREIMGVVSPLTIESVRDEKHLLLRLVSVVRRKDPDMLLSWDSQGAGLGYIVERGANIGNPVNAESNPGGGSVKLDMARLLGRLPKAGASGYNKNKGGAGIGGGGR